MYRLQTTTDADLRDLMQYIIHQVKLLEIYFDKRLTWKAHIESLVERSKIGLNLMRAISGTTWGGKQKYSINDI